MCYNFFQMEDYMMLYYDKNNSYEIKAPNIITLFSSMVKSETNKNYLTLKQCAKIAYTLNQSIVNWNDDDYVKFIGSFDVTLADYYMTVNSNQKGQFKTITKRNVETLKESFDFMLKLFINIMSSMIIDGKRKLFIGE